MSAMNTGIHLSAREGTCLHVQPVDDIEEMLLESESPVRSAADLHRDLDAPDVTKNDVLDALGTLQHLGKVDRESVGANAVAWWHVDRVRPPDPSPEDHPAQTGLDELDRDAPAEAGPRDRPPAEARRATYRDDLRRRVRDIGLPGSGSLLEERERLVVDMIEAVVDRGGAKVQDLKSEFVEPHDGENEKPFGFKDTESVWSNLIRAEKLFAELEDVEAPGQGGRTIRPTERGRQAFEGDRPIEGGGSE